MTYKVTGPNGLEVRRGHILQDFRGDFWAFRSLSRGPQPGKSAKVVVYGDGMEREFYAEVFNLTVEEV